MTEEQLGRAMAEAALAEGHRRAFPVMEARPAILPTSKQGRLLDLLRQQPRQLSDLGQMFGGNNNVACLIKNLRERGVVIQSTRKARVTSYTLIAEPEEVAA